MVKRKWKRVQKLSRVDDLALDSICKRTPGMTRYGNRARTSVMLPLDLAAKVALIAKLENKTVNQVINELISKD
jgi:hypothetical protein